MPNRLHHIGLFHSMKEFDKLYEFSGINMKQQIYVETFYRLIWDLGIDMTIQNCLWTSDSKKGRLK